MEEGEEAKEARDQLHQAVGVAISAWAEVEMALTLVFSATLGPSLTLSVGHIAGGGAMNAVFYSVENYRSRMRMIDAALKAVLVDESEESSAIHALWQQASRRTDNLAKARNRIAHWNVTTYRAPNGKLRAKLLPPFFDMQRAHPGVAIHDVAQWGGEFAQLAQEQLMPIVHAMGSHKGLRRRFAQNIAAMVHNLRVDQRPEEADELLGWLTPPVTDA